MNSGVCLYQTLLNLMFCFAYWKVSLSWNEPLFLGFGEGWAFDALVCLTGW